MTSFLVIRKTHGYREPCPSLSELIDKVEGGEGVIITRHGKPVARLSPIERAKKPVRSLAAFRATVPRWGTSSAKLLRQMRDEQH